MKEKMQPETVPAISDSNAEIKSVMAKFVNQGNDSNYRNLSDLYDLLECCSHNLF